MLLSRKGLYKVVNRHFSSRYLLKLNIISLDLLLELVTMDINMFKLSNKL
jgi:hypothetical protein